MKNDGKLRKNHDGRFAGAGTEWAFHEDEETYKDLKVDMKTPYDYMSKEEREKLNGEVKKYNLKNLEG